MLVLGCSGSGLCLPPEAEGLEGLRATLSRGGQPRTGLRGHPLLRNEGARTGSACRQRLPHGCAHTGESDGSTRTHGHRTVLPADPGGQRKLW